MVLEGIEPNCQPPYNIMATDLQSAVGNKDQICNTLRYAFRQRHRLNEECVLKHSKILRLPVLKECFNTL